MTEGWTVSLLLWDLGGGGERDGTGGLSQAPGIPKMDFPESSSQALFFTLFLTRSSCFPS